MTSGIWIGDAKGIPCLRENNTMLVATLPALTPYLATAGIGWLYYRRIRRSFGRQSWQPRRTIARLVLVSVVALALAGAAVFLPHVGIGMGAAAGAALGMLALKHTHAQVIDGQRYYTPNPWIGGGLSLLLLGRLAWRWSQGAPWGGSAQAAQQASPLTMGYAKKSSRPWGAPTGATQVRAVVPS